MSSITQIVIFLTVQAGALIWILSRHDNQIQNLTGWLNKIDARADTNGRNIGQLEGVNEERYKG